MTVPLLCGRISSTVVYSAHLWRVLDRRSFKVYMTPMHNYCSSLKVHRSQRTSVSARRLFDSPSWATKRQRKGDGGHDQVVYEESFCIATRTISAPFSLKRKVRPWYILYSKQPCQTRTVKRANHVYDCPNVTVSRKQ